MITMEDKLEFFCADWDSDTLVPLCKSSVSAGFPSPAEIHVDKRLDLNKYLATNPIATFYVRVAGTSMQDAGIYDKDLLVIDRSREVKNRDIVVCSIDGDFTVKRFRKQGKRIFLVPENPHYEVIEVPEQSDFEVWGVVSYVVHKV